MHDRCCGWYGASEGIWRRCRVLRRRRPLGLAQDQTFLLSAAAVMCLSHSDGSTALTCRRPARTTDIHPQPPTKPDLGPRPAHHQRRASRRHHRRQLRPSTIRARRDPDSTFHRSRRPTGRGPIPHGSPPPRRQTRRQAGRINAPTGRNPLIRLSSQRVIACTVSTARSQCPIWTVLESRVCAFQRHWLTNVAPIQKWTDRWMWR